MGEIRVTISDSLHKTLKQIALEQNKSLKSIIVEALEGIAKIA